MNVLQTHTTVIEVMAPVVTLWGPSHVLVPRDSTEQLIKGHA